MHAYRFVVVGLTFCGATALALFGGSTVCGVPPDLRNESTLQECVCEMCVFACVCLCVCLGVCVLVCVCWNI